MTALAAGPAAARSVTPPEPPPVATPAPSPPSPDLFERVRPAHADPSRWGVRSPPPPPADLSTPNNEATVSPRRRRKEFPIERFGLHLGTAPRTMADEDDPEGLPPLFVFGLTYRLQAPRKRALLQPDLYLDFADRSGPPQPAALDAPSLGRGFIGFGASLRATAFLPRGLGAAYAGAGLGLYRLTFSRHVATWADWDDWVPIASGFRTGGKVFAGLKHREGLFAEATWHDPGSLAGRHHGGLVLSFGIRR